MPASKGSRMLLKCLQFGFTLLPEICFKILVGTRPWYDQMSPKYDLERLKTDRCALAISQRITHLRPRGCTVSSAGTSATESNSRRRSQRAQSAKRRN